MLSPREKRSCFDAMHTILKTCNARKDAAEILCQTVLSDEYLMRYLTTLVGYGLLETVGEDFRTTDKGRLFVERFEGLLETLEKGRV